MFTFSLHPLTLLSLEVMCQVCKTGHHPITMLRRRLDDDTFERLLAVRDAANAAKAADAALGASLIGEAIDVD